MLLSYRWQYVVGHGGNYVLDTPNSSYPLGLHLLLFHLICFAFALQTYEGSKTRFDYAYVRRLLRYCVGS